MDVIINVIPIVAWRGPVVWCYLGIPWGGKTFVQPLSRVLYTVYSKNLQNILCSWENDDKI